MSGCKEEGAVGRGRGRRHKGGVKCHTPCPACLLRYLARRRTSPPPSDTRQPALTKRRARRRCEMTSQPV